MAKGYYYIAVTPDAEEREICRGESVPDLAKKLGVTEHMIRTRLHGTAINTLDRLMSTAPRYRDDVKWFIRSVESTPTTQLPPEESEPESAEEPSGTEPVCRSAAEPYYPAQVIRELQPIAKHFQIGYEFQLCSACRTRVSSGDKYCRGCGRPLIKAVPLR